jgi:hypothetical protein
VVLAAMLLTSPLPTIWWGPATLLLASIPGTLLMNRVRLRAERRRATEDGRGGER